MKTSTLISVLTLLLLALWIPVALDKLWDLEGFHRTLLRQPFPNWWAGVLYWLLPILELACALLLVGGAIVNPKTNQTVRFRTWGFALSSLLMLGFTLFILFGVLGWYEKRPCGCGSVISGLSWEQHLWFNVVFLLMSVLGWWLSGDVRSGGGGHPGPPGQGSVHPSGPSTLDAGMKAKMTRSLHFVQPFRYPRRFAVFPGRPARSIERVPPVHPGQYGCGIPDGYRGTHTAAACRKRGCTIKKMARCKRTGPSKHMKFKKQ